MEGTVNQLLSISSRISENMGNLVGTNEKINHVNKIISEIAEKTKSINDIVVKTQILSLNASIEAERAGEHGRSFAVVAREVGALSSQTGELAEAITNVVSVGKKNSETAVSENTEVVNLCNSSVKQMSEIMESVIAQTQNLAAQSNSVALQSSEQLTALKAINSGISKVQSISTENIILAKKTMELSNSLNEQTHIQNEVLISINKLVA